jgi:AmmeMemoRadiSam system protein A/AmmeMemoRadiSam system protein B
MGRISRYYALPHPPIIIPEIGRGEEGAIQETTEAFNRVSQEIADTKPDTIILITPHGPLFQDGISITQGKEIQGSMSRFGAPQVSMRSRIDEELTERILSMAREQRIPTVEITGSTAHTYGVPFALDHGSTVPMYFVNKKYTNYQLVHITYGLLPKTQLYEFGKCIKKAVEQSTKNVVFIASGDLSHRLIKDGPYDYSSYGEKFDREIRVLLEKGDVAGVFNMDPVMVREAGECALRSYYILLGALDGCEFRGQTLSYQGNFGVGYLVMKFMIEQNPYVRLAKDSLEYYLSHGDYMKVPSYVNQEMREQKRGVFVSLKKRGELRGCIGTILPVTDSLANEIIRNAVEAGIHDPRFWPVREEELDELEVSVDVLTEPEPAQKDQLDPKKYGVIVRSGYRTGLLLPDLEGVETAEDQLNIALQKAGISRHSPYTIERFQVIRHKGEDHDQ